jgi:hypothetical protein
MRSRRSKRDPAFRGELTNAPLRARERRVGVLDTKHGFLVTLEKTGDDAAVGYVGTVAENDVSYPVAFSVGQDGAVALVPMEPPCPAELAERARLVVRTTLKQNAGLDLPPPRRITRWRPAK